MSKVFFSVSVSLDGYLVPPGMNLEHAGDPAYEDWGAQWGKLQSWIFPQRFFQEMLKLGEGGETGTDNQIVEHTFRRTGVSIMGKRMFDLGLRRLRSWWFSPTLAVSWTGPQRLAPLPGSTTRDASADS